MTHDNDFVSEEIVEFNIDERTFGYKPVTAGEENDWLNLYLKIDSEGKTYQDFTMLNRLKLNNLVKVPYDKELIKLKIGVDKNWSKLSNDEKYKFLGKLRPSLFSKIIDSINKIDKAGGDSLKNC